MIEIVKQIAKYKKSTNMLFFNYTDEIENGVVFLFCSWSPATISLKYLLNVLREFSELPLYIFDIDSLEYREWSQVKRIKSNGYGEVIFIKNNKVLGVIPKISEVNKNHILKFISMLLPAPPPVR